MAVIYIVLPLAIVMASLAMWAFFAAVGKGQFDDLDTPPHRAVFPDDGDR
jgi:cbb3-type cytochrome oxidase maturation protein